MSIQVILYNQKPLYTGILLQGTVKCILNSNTSVRAIKIRFYGKECISWKQKQGKHHVYYKGEHHFFQMETKLFQPENEEMHPGTYEYPFKFLVPSNIPSPFEFPYGYIRYSLKGIIDIPFAIDPRHRLDLEFISLLDISTLPNELKQPFHTNNNESMGFCLFSSGTISMEAQINKRAFLPGETIIVNIEIDNLSDGIINFVKLKLLRCFVAHSETPSHKTKFINEDLLEENSDGMSARSNKIYNFNLQIPLNIGIPNMSGCQLLEGLYRLEVLCDTSGLNKNIQLTLCEIQIGHIDGPNWLNNSTSYPYPSVCSTELPNSTNFDPSAPNIEFERKDSPPPQYEDVVKNN